MANKIKAGKWEYTDAELDEMQAQAKERGRVETAREPRAIAARYDAETGRLILDLANGATFMLPVNLLQGLRGAAPEDLAMVEIWSNGAALHWEKLDADFRIPDLLSGVLGGKTWMSNIAAEMGKKGGAATSEAKAAAVRENGKKGGRPKKENAA